MSAFNRNKVTRNGALLSSATLSGSELTFTKIVIGDGTYIGDLEEAEGLVSPKIDLQIKAIVSNGNKVTLTTSLLPKDITSDFYWREVGVFAKGADDVEVLFMYATAEDTSFISTNSLDEKTISLGIIVSNAENVTAIIDDGLVYATQADIESHNISATAHQDIREAIANIDLTSVTTKVSQEHELTRARVNNQHAETREHITNETNRCVNNTDDQAENIKVYVTSQHETTRNTVRAESISNTNNLNNAKNEINANVNEQVRIMSKLIEDLKQALLNASSMYLKPSTTLQYTTGTQSVSGEYIYGGSNTYKKIGQVKLPCGGTFKVVITSTRTGTIDTSDNSYHSRVVLVQNAGGNTERIARIPFDYANMTVGTSVTEDKSPTSCILSTNIKSLQANQSKTDTHYVTVEKGGLFTIMGTVYVSSAINSGSCTANVNADFYWEVVN